uniref:Uncharacterized protein n=1 Tax=Anguilla anguilla TaxID=7936 RepID=A0A0E9S9G9_ANGAN
MQATHTRGTSASTKIDSNLCRATLLEDHLHSRSMQNC